jgi:NAD(P)H dehydrogenase (quinone)
MTNIAITGSTGQLGRLAIPALKRRAPDATIIALARDPARAADLGVPVRQADYTRPETLRTALAGVDVLVLISSNDFADRAGQHRNAIEAAKAAGVTRIVYTSILKGDASPLLLANDHIATEAALKESGVAYSILRNGWYTENYTGSLGAALEHGAIIGSAGAGRLSTATRADFAEAIATVAADPGEGNHVHELAGDEAYTLAELAAEVSRQSGRHIVYTDLPAEAYAAALQGFGLPETFAWALADSDVRASEGALHDDGRTLSSLIGRPTTPVSHAVTEALTALGG